MAEEHSSAGHPEDRGGAGEEPPPEEHAHAEDDGHGHGGGPAALTLGALGIVFGDIGTSPLYAMRECFAGEDHLPSDPVHVLGVVSLIVWSLIVVISLKYVAFVMRADNRGEGGILALMAHALPSKRSIRGRFLWVSLGLFGAALLYGDGIVTPAISVLSALEGLAVRAPALEDLVVPAALVILGALFGLQRAGTTRVGGVFGPFMVLWFATLAVLGIASVVHTPQVLAALDPRAALRLAWRDPGGAFAVLAPVFLVVTGGEALYADMGHFGRAPIQRAWVAVVFPALVLAYLGQGALLIRDPSAVANPFYHLAPGWLVYPLVALATVATVIASQAVISGAFSLTRQAMSLGYLPRLEIRHSSAHQIGQVYVPSVNRLLLIGTVLLVVGFGSSSALAGAYGVAISLTMVITTLLVGVCAHVRWGWPRWRIVLVTMALLSVDLLFTTSNLDKVVDGGWVPLSIAAAGFLMMTTWRRGRALLAAAVDERRVDARPILERMAEHPPFRAPRTGVFLDSHPGGLPTTLLHNLKHNHVLHERVILLHVVTADTPRVPAGERLILEHLPAGVIRVMAFFGFMESARVPEVIDLVRERGIDVDVERISYFLGRETLVITGRPGLAHWRKELFAYLSRNARRATEAFGIPPGAVIEVGVQVEL